MSQPSEPRTFLQFIRTPILFHKIMGHELYAHRSKNRLRSLAFNVYYYLGFGFYNLHVVLEVVYFVQAIRFKESVLPALNAASCVCFCLVANFKQVALALNKQIFRSHMDQLEAMFPVTLAQQRDFKLAYHERRMQRVMGIFAWLCLAFTSTFSLYPIVRSLVRHYLLGVPHYERTFGFYIWYPYNATASAAIYWPTYIGQMHGATLAGLAFLSGDLLLVSSITQICMHFDHIAKCLLELPMRVDDNGTKAEAKKLRILKILARRHAKCLELSEHLNKIFSIALLLNFLIASLTICFIGFQLIASTMEDILKFCVFLMASLGQVLVVCNYGDELLTASIRVGDAAYNQNWFECNKQYKRMLVYIIARSQKPASIRPPTFPPISFRTYMKVISMSYQFFALLRTTYYGDE